MAPSNNKGRNKGSEAKQNKPQSQLLVKTGLKQKDSIDALQSRIQEYNSIFNTSATNSITSGNKNGQNPLRQSLHQDQTKGKQFGLFKRRNSQTQQICGQNDNYQKSSNQDSEEYNTDQQDSFSGKQRSKSKLQQDLNSNQKPTSQKDKQQLRSSNEQTSEREAKSRQKQNTQKVRESNKDSQAKVQQDQVQYPEYQSKYQESQQNKSSEINLQPLNTKQISNIKKLANTDVDQQQKQESQYSEQQDFQLRAKHGKQDKKSIQAIKSRGVQDFQNLQPFDNEKFNISQQHLAQNAKENRPNLSNKPTLKTTPTQNTQLKSQNTQQKLSSYNLNKSSNNFDASKLNSQNLQTNSNFDNLKTGNGLQTKAPQQIQQPQGQKQPQQEDRQYLTPLEATQKYGQFLSPYEKVEIFQYTQIYYCGQGSDKISGTSSQADNNHGFDDERGDYTSTVRDHIGYRFEILGSLGKGSFGCVLKCYDHKSKCLRAVKIIRNKKRFKQQGMVEITILDNLRRKDYKDQKNIVRMMQSFWFRNHLCLSQELLSSNLYELINQNHFQGISPTLIRKFTQQICLALQFLQTQQIIHCDLKPENVMLKTKDKVNIKVIDFGSSCYINQRVYTYIQSRFYRAPEVILGIPYNQAIDMWSLGCIVAELYTGYPLFPGESEQEQLQCIMEVMGYPPLSLVQKSTRQKLFFTPANQPILTPNSRGKVRKPGTRSLARVLKTNDQNLLSFLHACLKWHPQERLMPTEAMQHPFLQQTNSQNEIYDTNPGPMMANIQVSSQYNVRDGQIPTIIRNQYQVPKSSMNMNMGSQRWDEGAGSVIQNQERNKQQAIVQRPYSGTVSDYSAQDSVYRHNSHLPQQQTPIMKQTSVLNNGYNQQPVVPNQGFQERDQNLDQNFNRLKKSWEYKKQGYGVNNSLRNGVQMDQ